ncbi:hypothetical protein [Streptomyces sp. NPDC002785]|uniref:hypothetical protein n=1 Tax=Streptomyces sp. NPDC002785 TaxID=3154543 RepID=UPI00331EF7B1
MRAAWRRLRALDVANQIALGALALSLITLAVNPLSSAYNNLFGNDTVAIEAKEMDHFCQAEWSVLAGNDQLLPRLANSADKDLARWEQQNRIAHRGLVVSLATVRGNAEKAAVLRDVTITVLRRETLPAGLRAAPKQRGCGGAPRPEAVGVNLDLLAVGRPVSVTTLAGKPGQRAAAKEAADYGDPVALPHTLTADDVYSLFLIGMTERFDCSWQATFSWWDGEESRETVVNNEGRPFRVIADPRAAS